ncbi:hypothetical protein QR680_001362 [Steinernema hermaphroditum]|uniref:Uncharacterized protein n=1 Tax=Steinernema hermaphroditum TaxID=289476 RepID=A0AA39GZW4_9BILA|nr:hypothetical protein QR680_001362 [Steinernema hermaphroditum]
MAEDDDLPPSYDEVMKRKTPSSSPRSTPGTVRAESVSTLPTISESEEDGDLSEDEADPDDRRSYTSTVVDETAESSGQNEPSSAENTAAVGGSRRVRRVTIGESETIEIEADDDEAPRTPRGSRVYPLEQFMTDNPYKYLSLRHGWTPTPPCPHEEQEDEDDVDAPTKRRLVATVLLFAFISILIFVIAKLLEGAKHSVPTEMRPKD